MVSEPRLRVHEPLLIKRYGDHRLYNTVTLTYASLDDVKQLVLQRVRFIVRDAATGQDVTGTVLDRLA